MSRLKHSTLEQHQEVEALMPVLRPDLTMQSYARLLAQLYRVVQPLEAGLQEMELPEAFALPERLKTPFLAQDLQVVSGLQPTPGAPQYAPGVPEALGILYVLEGATLGGQVIGRHLRTALGLTPHTGGAYFHAYGVRTGVMWKAFAQAMNQGVVPDQEARVVEGARLAFDGFRRVLQGAAA